MPLSAYANALRDADVRLDDFIGDYFRRLGCDGPVLDMLRADLKAGRALLLLDGLDEVRETALRQTVVERVTDFFAFHRKAGNKFVLTSRIVGYREVRTVAEGLGECTLVDFDDDEIALFAQRWTAALARQGQGRTVAAETAERERQELVDAVGGHSGVRRLASKRGPVSSWKTSASTRGCSLNAVPVSTASSTSPSRSTWRQSVSLWLGKATRRR